MALVATQSNPASASNMATGRYLTDATAAAITITLAFTPRYIRVINNTSGDMMEWFEGMASPAAAKTVAAGTRTAITTNGISVSGNQFIIGLDTDVNVINEQLSWVAFR